MKNLSISLKFFASFGAVICLLAVVSLWSIFGIRGIVGNAGEVIEGNQLRGEMVQREVDHLNWVAEVNALLTDETVTELHVETDDKKCGLGVWLYGKGREDAERLIPELKGLLKDVEEPHAKLHESAIDICKVFVQADVGLPGLLAMREVDHLKWADQIRDTFLQNRDKLEVQTDPTQCALGKWLKTDSAGEIYKKGSPEFKRNWDEMLAVHRDLHHSAEEVGAAYSQRNKSQEERLHDAGKVFEEVSVPLLNKTLGLLDTLKHEAEEALEGMNGANQIFASQTQPNLQKVQGLLGKVREMITANVMTDEQMIAAAGRTNTAVIICSIIALIVGVVFAFVMSRSITGPLAAAVAMITEMSRGHLGMRLKMDRGDEIGKMAKAMDDFADDLQNEMVAALEKLAEGDLTFDANPKDKEDVIGNSLKKTGDDLNRVLGEISAATEQINSGAGQVSDSSQALSQGATEQAASLEEITSSMTEMASQTKTNAENAGQANQLASEAKGAAETGNGQMQEMVTAMGEINEAGQSISKIIKVIDEIAFQTNLLALNAAVEAARAGRHGKGFAVVAEEVRNLAARSAKAAKETAELIEGSVAKTENGTTIANQTAESLAEIVSSVTKVTDLVGEIAAASNEQAEGIAQVNQGLTQIDQVTQQNTASAEEGASAAEELSSQAMHLQQLMSTFKVKGVAQGSQQPALAAPARQAPQQAQGGWESLPGPEAAKSQKPDEVISLDDEEFGKY